VWGEDEVGQGEGGEREMGGVGERESGGLGDCERIQ